MKFINATILILVLALVFLSGYLTLELTGKSVAEREIAHVINVIDGDTIDTDIGKIRLLGINCPEKGMLLYQDAKDFLRVLVLNETIEFESSGLDKYDRILGHVFLDGMHLNEELVKAGLAHVYYYEEDAYTGKLAEAEEYARKNELGIWEKSENYGCVKLVELDYTEETRCNDEEKIILRNDCEKFSVTIKDDATHIYDETLEKGFWEKSFSCIWNDAGDSLFIWDDKGLVLFYRY